MNTEQIARVAHEINRAYCLALGDTSQPEWKNAPDWQKSSAINNVNFHIANPDAGADHSHIEWMAEKESKGWKYGLVKDPDKKEHPCFLPYEELPTEQKAKDYIFRGVVHALS
ncbi:RyR domain-containing protein [Methyloglobulus sp.]|uniref:RyR domain-containing protein n=1 Tax=Methyloglobulus sp. TaxID=2518622 RepID=UPI003989D20E